MPVTDVPFHESRMVVKEIVIRGELNTETAAPGRIKEIIPPVPKDLKGEHEIGISFLAPELCDLGCLKAHTAADFDLLRQIALNKCSVCQTATDVCIGIITRKAHEKIKGLIIAQKVRFPEPPVSRISQFGDRGHHSQALATPQKIPVFPGKFAAGPLVAFVTDSGGNGAVLPFCDGNGHRQSTPFVKGFPWCDTYH